MKTIRQGYREGANNTKIKLRIKALTILLMGKGEQQKNTVSYLFIKEFLKNKYIV